MTLEEIASGAPSVPLAVIGGDKTLTRKAQERLGVIPWIK
jgi:D-aminopeptidase